MTNVYMGSPFGFSPFGMFSPFSPFGFGFGFGIPFPLLVLFVAGFALTSFRSSRGSGYGADSGFGGGAVADTAGAALCLQVACYCDDRRDSLYGRLGSLSSSADTASYDGLQSLVSDACLAMLRSSNDWLAGRTTSTTSGLFGKNDAVETDYNRLVVQERAKFDSERRTLTRSAPGQPTYLVATIVVLLRSGSSLPDIASSSDLRDAIQSLAAEVSVEDNLLGAELLWTPEDGNDVMDRDQMFLDFPELVSI